MKRTLCAVLLLLTFSIVACGGGGGASNSNTNSNINSNTSSNTNNNYESGELQIVESQPTVTVPVVTQEVVSVPISQLEPGSWYVGIMTEGENSRLLQPEVGDQEISFNVGSNSRADLNRTFSVYPAEVDPYGPMTVELFDFNNGRNYHGKNVVLLHGILSNANRMSTMRDALKATRRYDRCLSIGYNYKQGIDSMTRDVLQVIADHFPGETGGIDIIGHSLGGLISRNLVERNGMYRHTNNLITLGTPHTGTTYSALVLLITNTVPEISAIMNIFSREGILDAARDMLHTSSFIHILNSPSNMVVTSTDYYSLAGNWRNTGGDGIVAVVNASWNGLANECRHWRHYEMTGESHTSLSESDKVIDQVKEILSNEQPSDPPSNPDPSPNPPPANDLPPTPNPTPDPPSSPSPTPGSTQVDSGNWQPGEGGSYPVKYRAEWQRLGGLGHALGPVHQHNHPDPIVSQITPYYPHDYQLFARGILVNLGTNVFGVQGGLWDAYQSYGASTGMMGCPILPQRDFARSGVSGELGHVLHTEGGYVTHFRGGYGYVNEAFASHWHVKGVEAGENGFPISNAEYRESGINGARGRVQLFEGATMFHYVNLYEITTYFNTKYWSDEWDGLRRIGFPQQMKQYHMESGVSHRKGESQLFQGGCAYELGGSIWLVHGRIHRIHQDAGGPGGRYGFPIANSNADNSVQSFEGGVIDLN